MLFKLTMSVQTPCNAPPNSLAAAAVWLPSEVAPWYEATRSVCSAILGVSDAIRLTQ